MTRPVFILLLLVSFLLQLLFASGDNHSTPTTLVFPSYLHTMGIRKATKTHLRIYTRNKVKVRDPQGIAVVRLESWDDPKETKDDDEVTGYGVNSGENMVVYNKSMNALSFYGKNMRGNRGLNHPMGIAANERGDVYVADTGNHRIVRFYNPKQELKFVAAIGGKGALPGRFNAPYDVALDAYGMVYVSDTKNHRVQVLRSDDKLHHWFGRQGVQDGELWHPTGIAVTNGKEKWSYFKDRFIALLDLDGTRIQKFSLDGKFQKAIRLKDFGYETGKLQYLAIDYYSQIWVTDFENHCVHKFDRDLNYLTSFGKQGDDDREFIEPRGIAIFKRFGQVFIAEKESAQYYWIGTDVFDFDAEWLQEKGVIRLDFFLTEPTFVTLSVKNVTDGSERLLFEKSQYFSGQSTIQLDGTWKRIYDEKLNAGNGESGQIIPVTAGKYKFLLKVEPTYSSYKYFSKEVETTLTVDPH